MPPKKRATNTAGPRSSDEGRLQQAIDATVRRMIIRALRVSRGSVVEAARWLGISRVALWARLSKLGIDADRYK